MLDYAGSNLNFKAFWNGLDAEVTGEKVLSVFGLKKDYGIRTDTFETEVTKTADTEKWGSFILGGNFRVNKLDSDMLDGSHRQKLYGLFLEDEFVLNSNLTAFVGARYDHHPLVLGNVSPRLGIVYSIGKDQYVRISYSTAYGLPTFVQSYLKVGPYAGNKQVDVEKIRSFNIGYEGMFRGRFGLKADIFYNRLYDFIRWPVDPLTSFTYTNSDSYDVLGGEFGLDVSMTERIELIINYAYLHVKYSDRDDRFEESPESRVNAGIAYLSDTVFGSLFVHYVSSTKWPSYRTSLPANFGYDFRESLGSHTLVVANMGYRIANNLELSLNIFNLFNRRIVEYPMGDELRRKILGRITCRF